MCIKKWHFPRFLLYLHIKSAEYYNVNMKKNYTPILLATALALVALLVSQFLWLRYASQKDIQEQTISFQSGFNKSVSALVNEFMGKDATDLPYKIVPLDEENGENVITEEEREKAIDAGYTSDKSDVTTMIENALIVLSIKDNSFHLSRLDTLLTTLLNEKGNVVSSYITLQDTKENKILDEVRQEYIPTNSRLFVKTYTAERKIEIPSNSFVIKAEYRIKQPSYLKRLGVVTVTSFIASLVIISVLFYLLFIVRRRYIQVSNMEKSFHGAIHDLKSPLAFVYFTLSALEEKETDLKKKTALSLTGDRVRYLTNKILRLLKAGQNWKKIPEDEKQSVFLYDMLEQIEAEVRTMFQEKTIEFENNIVSELYLWGVPDLLEAALRILIENAVKYNNGSPEVKVIGTRDDTCITIEVVDNGNGISKQQLKHLFSPYYTTDSKHGTGIGLFYAKRIIRAHGGKILAESTEGKGSSFTIKFPKK